MASGNTWPSTLSQAYQQGSFNATPKGNILRTDMDSGLAKTRRLFTAVSDDYSGSMVFDTNQLATFVEFYKTTLGFGINTFNFPDPFDSLSTVEVRFNIATKNAPYTITPWGDTADFLVNLNLETI